MKSLILLLSILLFNVLIFSPIHTSSRDLAPEKGSDIVEETCKKTKYYDLCMSSLKSDPRSSTADLYGLVNITLDHIMSNANATLNYVTDLAEKTTEFYMRLYLDDCVQMYGLTVDNRIPDAVKSLKAKDYNDVVGEASWCADDAETCEEQFEGEPNPRKSPLTNQNAFIHDFCGLAAEIAHMLIV